MTDAGAIRGERRRRGFYTRLRPAALIFLVLMGCEWTLRAAYAVRNAAVTDIPLPYVAGDAYGPLPPWYDGLRILQRDPNLIWKGRANLERRYVDVFSPIEREEMRFSLARRFVPDAPEWLSENPSWGVKLNSWGFRDEEFGERDRSVRRIVCLGDSWTFGANVEQDQTFPAQLEGLLNPGRAQARTEVLNLGVMGYSSFQGLKLMRRAALGLEPDVVVLGFGMNDGQLSFWRDRDMIRHERRFAIRLQRVVRRMELAKLLVYLRELMLHEEKSLGSRIMSAAQTARKSTGASPSHELTDYTRVAPDQFESNVREMVRLAREAGAEAVLLHNELHGGAGAPEDLELLYRAALERISRDENVPFVDSGTMLAEARRAEHARLEAELGLGGEPSDSGVAGGASSGAREVVFRVHANGHDVPDALFISGSHPSLGDARPNLARMHDDGSAGDQVAGDGVWSLRVALSPDETVFYVYTNSGREGEWEGLDVPHVRSVTIGELEEVRGYLPIERFGSIYMQADGWHTDARGYRMIAEEIAGRLSMARGELATAR